MATTSEAEAPGALAYVDTDLDTVPGLRDRVNAMIRTEMQSMPQRDYTEHLPEIPELRFEGTVFLQREMERLRKRLPLKEMDKSRYALNPPARGRVAEAQAWREAVDNAAAQLEHQQGRMVNLELMHKYGPSAWRAHAAQLEGMKQQMTAQLSQVRSEAEGVNRERKMSQTSQQPILSKLSRKWGETVSKNYLLEYACAELERDVKRLRREAEAKGIGLPESDILDEAAGEGTIDS